MTVQCGVGEQGYEDDELPPHHTREPHYIGGELGNYSFS